MHNGSITIQNDEQSTMEQMLAEEKVAKIGRFQNSGLGTNALTGLLSLFICLSAHGQSLDSIRNGAAASDAPTSEMVSLGARLADRIGSFELVDQQEIGTLTIQREEISSKLKWHMPANMLAGWYQVSFPATSRFQVVASQLDENEPFRLTAIHPDDAASVPHSAFAFKAPNATPIALTNLPEPLLNPTPVQTWRSSQPLWIDRNTVVELEVRRPLLVVGGLEFQPVPADAQVSLTLKGEAPYNMFTDAKPVRFHYELRNLSGQSFHGALQFTLKDVVDGSAQERRVEVSIKPGGIASDDMDWKPEFGAYRLTADTLNEAGKMLYSEQRHLTYGPAIDLQTLPDSWPVGFHRSPSEPDIIPPIGAKWIRVWGGWGEMERIPGHYDWSLMDRNVAMAQKYGYRLLWVCHGVPLWSLPEKDRTKQRAGALYAPANIDQIRPFLRAFWERYAKTGVFGAVEIGNEPNAHPGWSPNQYGQYARAIYEETHRATTNVKVVGISMSGGLHAQYMEDSLRAGLDTTMDIASLHLYEVANPVGERSIETKIRTFDRILRAHGLEHLPVWNTESGAPMDIRQDGMIVSQEELNRQIRQNPNFNPDVPWRVGQEWRAPSELLGTAWAIRASFQEFAMGVEKNFMFAWSGSPHFTWVHDYQPGGNPLPKLTVAAAGVMSAMLRDYGPQPTQTQPVMQPAGNWLVFAHRFAGPRGRMTVVYVQPSTVDAGSGDPVATLATGGDHPATQSKKEFSPWLRAQSPAPVRVWVPVEADRVIVTDMLGRKLQSLQAVNGNVEVAATEIPQYVLEMNK
jgi:hypothetical protein